jgi:hypothetical protein
MCIMWVDYCINLSSENLIPIFEFWGIHKSVAEESDLFGYDTASGGTIGY